MTTTSVKVSAKYQIAVPQIARMKLNMIMSDVGWGLWAAIQAKISTIDFDFWGWAEERWGRAVEKMDSAELPLWLKDVTEKVTTTSRSES